MFFWRSRKLHLKKLSGRPTQTRHMNTSLRTHSRALGRFWSLVVSRMSQEEERTQTVTLFQPRVATSYTCMLVKCTSGLLVYAIDLISPPLLSTFRSVEARAGRTDSPSRRARWRLGGTRHGSDSKDAEQQQVQWRARRLVSTNLRC